MGFIIAALLLPANEAGGGLATSKIHGRPRKRPAVDGEASHRSGPVSPDLFRWGVSFVHGSNDGQKGIGLVMLVLICMAPAYFALDMNSRSYDPGQNPGCPASGIMEISTSVTGIRFPHLVNFSVPAQSQRS